MGWAQLPVPGGRHALVQADAYAIEREAEDALAVIEAIRGPVHLLGHSYGGIVALEAALRTDRLRSLILYEPPINVGADTPPDDLADRLAALLATGDREAMLVTFLEEGPRYPPELIAAQRAQPEWAQRVGYAHTLAREAQAQRRYQLDVTAVSRLRVPTLLLLGSRSPPFFRTAIEALNRALPRSELAVLEGQHHNAMETAPSLFAEAVWRFLGGQLGDDG